MAGQYQQCWVVLWIFEEPLALVLKKFRMKKPPFSVLWKEFSLKEPPVPVLSETSKNRFRERGRRMPEELHETGAPSYQAKLFFLVLLYQTRDFLEKICSLLSPRKPTAVFFWALLLNQSTSQIPILSIFCESLGGSSLYTCHTAPCLPVHGDLLSFQKLRTDLFTKARVLHKPSSTSGVHVTTKQGAKISFPTPLETQ